MSEGSRAGVGGRSGAGQRLAPRNLVHRLAFQSLPRLLGSNGYLAGLLVLTPGISNRQVVGPGNDLCIEARHRSANTYAKTAFEIANPECNLASHTHQPGNAVRALRLGVPCLVIVRNPLDQGVSWREFPIPHLSARRILRDYYRFYEAVVPRVEPGRLVICRFEDVISAPDAVTRLANDALGCGFRHCDYPDPEVRRLATQRRHAAVRGKFTAGEREEVARELREHRLFQRAQRAYESSLEAAVSLPDSGSLPQGRQEAIGGLVSQAR